MMRAIPPKMIVRDGVLGVDMILSSEVLKDTSCPRTVSVVEVLSLHRADLHTICEAHEDLNRVIKKAAVKLALWRAFILVAEKVRHNRIDPDNPDAIAKLLKGETGETRTGWVLPDEGRSTAEILDRPFSEIKTKLDELQEMENSSITDPSIAENASKLSRLEDGLAQFRSESRLATQRLTSKLDTLEATIERIEKLSSNAVKKGKPTRWSSPTRTSVA